MAGPFVFVLVSAFALGSVQVVWAQEEAAQAPPAEIDAETTPILIPAREIDPQHVKKRRARHVRAKRQRKQWWVKSREVLFSGIELNAEQSKKVDEIIATQIENRTLFTRLDTQLSAATASRNAVRAKQLREEVRVARENLQSVHQLFDEMNELLDGDQKKIFDVNRAKLVSEGQGIRRKRQQSRAQRRKSNKAAVEEPGGETAGEGDDGDTGEAPAPAAPPSDDSQGVGAPDSSD